MKNKHITVALASLSLLVVAALAVSQYLDGDDTTQAPARTGSLAASAPRQAALPPADAAPLTVSGRAPAAPSSSSVTSELRQKYSKADLGRPFFQWAMAHLDQGGGYYARKLATHCKNTVYRKSLLGENNRAYANSMDSQAYQRKLEAVEQLRRRCGDMSEAELDDILRQTAPADLQARDPLLNILQVWSTQASRDERARKAQAFFVKQMDPLLADELGVRLFRAKQPGTIFFDGREWSLTDTPVVTAAIYLLPCELGLDCSAQKDLGLAIACSSEAVCHASRQERALKEALGGNQAELTEALALSRQMAAALRSGDPQRLGRGS